METVNRQLKKGILDILLLKLLEGKTMYGYELMSTLDTSSQGFFAMKEGTLYPILYRLEDAGYIQSMWEKEQEKRGVPRKYYTITQAGHEHLRIAQNELALLMKSIKMIMGVDFHG